jgi:HNH endonuclease
MHDRDIKILWGRSGNRCAICKLELTLDGTQETLGEMAHIVARSSDGPRGAGTMSVADRDAYDNLVLLCPTHHVQVDKDPATWTVARLRSAKVAHESWVSEQLGAGGIRVAPIDNSAFLTQREAAWIEASRGQVAMVLSLTPLRVSGETLDTLDKTIIDALEKACVPATDSRVTQVRTRPTEFGVANEDFPNPPHSHGYSVQIFRVGHCEYLCEFGAGVDHITRYAKERKVDLADANKVVRYTDIAIVAEHGLTWLSAAWDAILPFNYLTFTVALINTNLTTLYSHEDSWQTVFGFVVKSPVLKFSDVLAKGFDRPALLLESLRRMVNGYGLTLDRVHDDKKEYLRPERMR